MEIDEAISLCKSEAENYEKEAVRLYNFGQFEKCKDYIWKAEERRQIAEWLEELKEYRKDYTCFNCYNSSASFNDYPCCECRRCFKALDGIEDYYEEVNADDT